MPPPGGGERERKRGLRSRASVERKESRGDSIDLKAFFALPPPLFNAFFSMRGELNRLTARAPLLILRRELISKRTDEGEIREKEERSEALTKAKPKKRPKLVSLRLFPSSSLFKVTPRNVFLHQDCEMDNQPGHGTAEWSRERERERVERKREQLSFLPPLDHRA